MTPTAENIDVSEDRKAAKRERNRRYYAENRERIKARSKAWRDANQERCVSTRRAYRKNNAAKIKQRFQANKDSWHKWHWQYQKKKMTSDSSFAASKRVMFAMHRACSLHKDGKPVTRRMLAVRLLGCSWAHFTAHIESLFLPGMTWANHGRSGWHFDHIVPLSSFDMTDQEQLLKACNFKNVQPLWAADNVRKGAKIA